MKRIFIFFSFLFFIFLSKGQENNILIENGKSKYQIVIPSKATTIEKEASGVLQTYLFKISGLSLPVIYESENRRTAYEIHIGKTTDEKKQSFSMPNEDGVIITAVKTKLFLTGGSRKGSLYAVYTFLEDELGCKKYTQNVEFIPQKSTIAVNQNLKIEQIPSFDFRTTYFEDALNTQYADWHKLNYFFENRKDFVHTFDKYVPAEKYFKTNPEYFALKDGKRTPVNLCLSNEKVYKLIVDGIRANIKKDPNQQYWSVSQNDDETFCNCDLCNKKKRNGKDFSEILIPFVNRVAEEFPTKTISTLAYHRSIEAPIYSNVRKNVEIMLCFTHMNRAVSITNGPENAKMFRDFLAAWKSKTNDIFAWDYVCNYNHTISPFPNIPVLQPNLQYFQKQGIKKVFLNGIGNQKGEFSELKTYLISKLLWNVNADVEKLKKEFCQAFYGEAAPAILEYISLMESNVKKNKSIVDVWAHPTLNKNDFLNPENIKKYKKILNNGLSKVNHNVTLYNRVLKELASVEYAEIEVSSTNTNLNAAETKNLENKILSLEKNLNKAGVNLLKNGEQTIENYKKMKLKK